MKSPEFAMIREFLQKPLRLRLASTFYHDPAIRSRRATDADRKARRCERHPENREIQIVVDGAADYLLEDRVYALHVSDALLADCGENHQSYYYAGTPAGTQFWIYVTREQLICNLVHASGGESYDFALPTCYIKYEPHLRKMLIDAWEAVKSDGSPEAVNELSLMLGFCMARFARLCADGLGGNEDSTPRLLRNRVWQVMDYIEAQCGKECSIAHLVKLSGIGRTALLCAFRRYAGCSVLEYVNRQRVLRCRSLMRPLGGVGYKYKPSPLKVFAEELGFSSPQVFARWRKQHLAEIAADGLQQPPPRRWKQ